MEFAYLVRPAFDQRFLATATGEQRAVIQEHGAWLEARYAEGRVRFAGRCYDGPFGLVVLDADSEQDARTLMEADPSVRSGIQTAKLYPFRTFLAHQRQPEG
jgi:uncharacterized protein YciI